MWKKLFKFWGILWGIIAGLALLVGLIVGLYNLYDKFITKKVEDSSVKEYIFGSNFYYVQILTDNIDKVLAYGITTKDKDFNPSFSILENLFYADRNNPTDRSKDKSGTQIITLGKTRFSDLGLPDNIFAYLGAHDFYYHEEYYYGNPGNYQSYFFSANESGHLDVDYDNLSFFYNQNKNINPNDPEVVKFRNNSNVNTLYITASGEGWSNIILRKYLVGPDYYQTRVIPESSFTKVLDKDAEYKKLAKLSTTINVENIIAVLGKPLIINDKPTFDIRTDKTMNQRFDNEFKNELFFYKSKICSQVSLKTILSATSINCIKLIWETLKSSRNGPS